MLRTDTREDVSRIGPAWFFYEVTPRNGARPMSEFNWARGYTMNMLQLIIRQLRTGPLPSNTHRSIDTLSNLWDIQRAFPRTLADTTTALDFTIRGLHREPARGYR